jgi:hypothetical protein
MGAWLPGSPAGAVTRDRPNRPACWSGVDSASSRACRSPSLLWVRSSPRWSQGGPVTSGGALGPSSFPRSGSGAWACASMTFATQRWRCGSADTALRDRLDAFYVAGRQAELGQVVELRRDRSWPRLGGGGPAQARTIQTPSASWRRPGWRRELRKAAAGPATGHPPARTWMPTAPATSTGRWWRRGHGMTRLATSWIEAWPDRPWNLAWRVGSPRRL